MYYIFLSWKHRYKQTFAIACLFIVNKLHATDSNISGFWQNTDPRSIGGHLTGSECFVETQYFPWWIKVDSMFTLPLLGSLLSSEYFSTDSKQYLSEQYSTG